MGSNAVKTSKGGSAVPGAAPHFVWNEIFELYFPTAGKAPRRGEAAIKAGRADWHDVWRVLVDRESTANSLSVLILMPCIEESLFAPPSLPLKATGFALLSMALTRLPPTDVPALFGEGVMRTLSNHLRKSADGEKTLTRVAEKVVRPISTLGTRSITDEPPGRLHPFPRSLTSTPPSPFPSSRPSSLPRMALTHSTTAPSRRSLPSSISRVSEDGSSTSRSSSSAKRLSSRMAQSCPRRRTRSRLLRGGPGRSTSFCMCRGPEVCPRTTRSWLVCSSSLLFSVGSRFASQERVL
jgi:hypothetical protein